MDITVNYSPKTQLSSVIGGVMGNEHKHEHKISTLCFS